MFVSPTNRAGTWRGNGDLAGLALGGDIGWGSGELIVTFVHVEYIL